MRGVELEGAEGGPQIRDGKQRGEAPGNGLAAQADIEAPQIRAHGQAIDIVLEQQAILVVGHRAKVDRPPRHRAGAEAELLATEGEGFAADTQKEALVDLGRDVLAEVRLPFQAQQGLGKPEMIGRGRRRCTRPEVEPQPL